MLGTEIPGKRRGRKTKSRMCVVDMTIARMRDNERDRMVEENYQLYSLRHGTKKRKYLVYSYSLNFIHAIIGDAPISVAEYTESRAANGREFSCVKVFNPTLPLNKSMSVKC